MVSVELMYRLFDTDPGTNEVRVSTHTHTQDLERKCLDPTGKL